MIDIDPRRTALLVMDYQAEIVAMLGEKAKRPIEGTTKLLARARASGAAVVYVVVTFRPGYPEVNPSNATFSALTKSGRMREGTPGVAVIDAVRPNEGEVIVTKRRVGAFSGSDLDMVLRARGVDTIVLAGISTSGVVLSTVRHAADADYRIVVVKDACADPDDEVHRVLTEKIFLRQTTVATVDDVLASFDVRAGTPS